MSRLKPVERIIWALDAFGEPELEKQGAEALRAITEHSAPAIEPVYVLSPSQVNVSAEFYPDWEEAYRPMAQTLLNASLERSGLKGLAAAKILVAPEPSVRSAVESLLSYARERRTDLIAVSTHARKGALRAALGSFAETLFLRSPIPVYVTNPIAGASRKIDKIVFATDFSDAAKAAWDAVAEFARQMEARLILFHQVSAPLPVAPMAAGFGEQPVFRREMDDYVRTMRAQGEKWAEGARAKGILAEVLVEEAAMRPAAAILSVVERKGASMLAVVARTGPVASVLFGSTTRAVVRGASCPVWVLREGGNHG